MKREQTLVLLKPDALQRSLVGEIMRRIERTGLKLVALKMVRATEQQLFDHYGKDEEWFKEKGIKRKRILEEAGRLIDPDRPAIEFGKDIIRGNVAFMTASPLIAMVWEGNHAASVVKKIVGGTEPITSEVGTIRGDLQLDSYSLSDSDQRALRNLIHCSDPASEAEREIKVWFGYNEVQDYKHIQEEILYDINLDGIRE